MKPLELRAHAEQLYGPRWRKKLAEALSVSPRTIRYWLSGDRPIRPIVAQAILSLKPETCVYH